ENENEDPNPAEYSNSHTLFCVLRDAFKASSDINFHGSFLLDVDPLVSNKERVQLTNNEIWKVSGYRFRDNQKTKTGYKTRLWCCQDEDCKQRARPSDNPDAKRRDTVGMKRYKSQSRLRVTCQEKGEGKCIVIICLRHKLTHVHYYDVKMPTAAIDMIHVNIEWTTPVSMVGQVQATFPSVTAAQIHTAWTTMSKVLWKRDKDQLKSGRMLLEEFAAEAKVFDVPREEGVEQMGWAMKRIAGRLRGKIVEIGFDATFNTNQKHLELYSVIGEFNNAEFPLSYCLLSTASAISLGKRKNALTNWDTVLRDEHGLDINFLHLDKDMAGIGMGISTWLRAKIQLCYWHLKDAVETRLAKKRLSTTLYNAARTRSEFAFIDLAFSPRSRADPQEYEGG
ncbi:hypothetical protein B0H16DRAFT_1796560, partial [Mycena metata]